ncbi:C6 transcription factor [Pyrenophora tritici-repentis]|nr:C6 transcription factor [Pyrenophora tritici-repentis]KAG9382279.1 C6 transcription factor [Pyrenophora tritici-repentis]
MSAVTNGSNSTQRAQYSALTAQKADFDPLTCRARRVKCDETRPVCKACGKKNRFCQWEELHTTFKDYRPVELFNTDGFDNKIETKEDMMCVDGVDVVDGIDENNRIDKASEGQSTCVSSPSAQLPPSSRYSVPQFKSRTGVVSIASLLQSRNPEGTLEGSLPAHPHQIMQQANSHSHNCREIPEGTRSYSRELVPLAYEEALLVHHYTEYLGRWLDCTDATRQFALLVPEKIKQCPVLCYAVISFAARHCRKDTAADAAYQRCIAFLIEQINEDAASHDATLLCAIVILRFYEQLTVPSSTGSDDEQHLAGCSAIIRSSQGNHYVDPSAPTLHEAAFWVYVRQCLYNATIAQQPPDIDFTLQLNPAPGEMRDAHPLGRLKLETAWANQMTWYLARVVNFCFDGKESQNEKAHKMQRWQELWSLVQGWMHDKPNSFNAVFESPASDQDSFCKIFFTADWHTISFAFYHFAHIMLLRYRPGPKFAICNVGSLSDTNVKT